MTSQRWSTGWVQTFCPLPHDNCLDSRWGLLTMLIMLTRLSLIKLHCSLASCSSAVRPQGSESSAIDPLQKRSPSEFDIYGLRTRFPPTIFSSSAVALRVFFLFFLLLVCFSHRVKLILRRASCANRRLASCDVLFVFAGEAEVEKQIAATRTPKIKK